MEDILIFSEDFLEFFNFLVLELVSGGLYGIDDMELMGVEDKLFFEDSFVIFVFDCFFFNNVIVFSFLVDDS